MFKPNIPCVRRKSYSLMVAVYTGKLHNVSALYMLSAIYRPTNVHVAFVYYYQVVSHRGSPGDSCRHDRKIRFKCYIGRYIGENIRTVHDVISYLHERNLPGILLLIDFEKAFDTVKWSVIDKSMSF